MEREDCACHDQWKSDSPPCPAFVYWDYFSFSLSLYNDESVMSMIRNHCQVELALDDILYRLRLRRLERLRDGPGGLPGTATRTKSSITLRHHHNLPSPSSTQPSRRHTQNHVSGVFEKSTEDGADLGVGTRV